MNELRGKLLLAVGSTLFSILLIAVIGEFAVRYREQHRSTVPGTISMLYYQHARLGHALVRETDYFGWMRVNSQGFRGADVSMTPPDSVTRIMVVGASTTFDTQVTADDRTWVARMEHWLNRADPRHPVEVINAGTPGYEVIDNLIRLQTELYQYRPEMIILYQAHNDISCALSGRSRNLGDPRRPNQTPLSTPWGRWAGQHSLLYNKVVVALKWMRLRRDKAGTGEDQPESDQEEKENTGAVRCGASQFARDVNFFISAARTLDIQPVLVEVVHVSGPGSFEERDDGLRARWARARPYAEPDAGLRLYARYNGILRTVSDSWSIPFIETARFGLSGPEWYAPLDPMHFNDAGAEEMGRAMAKALLATGGLAYEQHVTN